MIRCTLVSAKFIWGQGLKIYSRDNVKVLKMYKEGRSKHLNF